MRPRAFLVGVLIGAVALALAPPGSGADQPKAVEGVQAVLELNQQFYYAGDPLLVRVTVRNDGSETVSNPVKTPLFKAFTIRNPEGAVIRPTGRTEAQEPSRLEKLQPKGFYGAVVELADLYPELRQPGRFTIQWSADGLVSNELGILMLPKIDPAKEYQARIETSEGAFTLEFFKKTSPLAMKAFIDLANAGYYDGLQINEVHPERYLVAGDPVASGVERFPFAYPQEQSGIPVVAGTVLMRPVGISPPANGSAFMVMLKGEPSWTGQATVLGQVIDGMDVLQKISRVPSSEQSSRPFYRPLKEVTIRKVAVVEKKPVAP